MLLTWTFSLFAFSTISCHALHDCPRDQCETCIPADVFDAPGIGFDLTSSYGTSAVHYHNGTVVEVVQFQGKPEYLELMTRLAKGGKPVLIEDQGVLEMIYFKILTSLNSFIDLPFPARAGWRWLSKKLDRPEKVDDINVIGEMLWALKLATEKHIHQDLMRIAITTPEIDNLSPELINTALEELDLRTWTGDCGWYPKRLIEADAVYAVNGHGLCKNYYDLWQCSEEFEGARSPVILFVSFTRHLLYTSVFIPNGGEALLSWAYDETKAFDFDLGLDRILEATDHDQELLWARIREQIADFARPSKFRITDLLLAGESITNTIFLENLKEAFAGLSGFHTGFNGDPFALMGSAHGEEFMNLTFAAARGAALYARRRQQVQFDCSELGECEISRQKERLGGQLKLDL